METSELLKLIGQLEEMEKKATEGEWEVQYISGLVPHRREIVVLGQRDNPVVKDLDIPNAMFIASCRNSAPLLLRLARAAVEMREAMARIGQQVCDDEEDGMSPLCQRIAVDALESFDSLIHSIPSHD